MATSFVKRKPRTVEQWKEARQHNYGHAGSNGGFRILPAKVLESDAFNELSKSEKLILIYSLAQLDYWSKKKHKGHPKRDTTIGALRNDGMFSLPNNYLIEKGIKGTDTIARAREKLQAVGFWETVQTGDVSKTGIYRWSDNWILYNQKPAHERQQIDNSARKTGHCLYPNILQFNKERDSRILCRTGSIQRELPYLNPVADVLGVCCPTLYIRITA
jgi:hypothetical protein